MQSDFFRVSGSILMKKALAVCRRDENVPRRLSQHRGNNGIVSLVFLLSFALGVLAIFLPNS